MKRFGLLLCLLCCFCSSALAERVVCLYGSFAEAWLAAGGTLVGVTEDAISERNLATDAQIVGTVKAPNLELVLELEPDWVILSADIAGHPAAMELLESAGIACTAYRVDTVEDYAAMMDEFTQRTRRRDVYEDQVVPMLAEIDEIIAEAQAKPAPSVLLLRAFSTGVKAKGADNLAGAMLRDLGCLNLADEIPSLLDELSLEHIVTRDPDWILISVMGSDEAAALAAVEASVGQNPAWQSLTAVKEGRVKVLDRELFHYKPNARWRQSYATLYEMLFP